MLLRRGDRGPAVADLREALASLQLLPSLNGTDRALAEFDAATDGAIRDFQQRRGLIVDGIVGPVTVRSLTDARWTLGDRTPDPHPVRADDRRRRDGPADQARRDGLQHRPARTASSGR